MREKLQEIRKKKGFTQESFAKEIDTSVKTLRHIEQGRSFPREKLMRKIMDKLEIKDLTVFEDIKRNSNRGEVTDRVLIEMNLLSDKQYTREFIRVIINSRSYELKDRKEKKPYKNLNIRERIIYIAKEKYNAEVTKEDIELYLKCIVLERKNRTSCVKEGE